MSTSDLGPLTLDLRSLTLDFGTMRPRLRSDHVSDARLHRDDSQLLHHAQRIPLFPLLGDCSIDEAIDADAAEDQLFFGGCDAHERSALGTGKCPASDDLVTFSDLIDDGPPGIGESSRHRGEKLAVLGAAQIPESRSVLHKSFRIEL